MLENKIAVPLNPKEFLRQEQRRKEIKDILLQNPNMILPLALDYIQSEIDFWQDLGNFGRRMKNRWLARNGILRYGQKEKIDGKEILEWATLAKFRRESSLISV